ncbi:hypothetical protein [Opitutus sp. ER46]|uniref:hypothetical protein n=1 Tax=Opitutus sp. ER46 TaxID=2161864 RepID=UPI000D31F9CB|nr:hypothetical protein [Opitutus sp. ER46]PTX98605.1 hypothetical protein DB354_04895 [Opitutus sp. ER46]
MGFFDRFTRKMPASQPANGSPVPAANPPAESAPTPVTPPVAASPVKPRLVAARERLEAKDLPGAMAIYEEILTMAGDRADVLVTVSGDLGTHGHVAQIIELVAPRYDAQRHGPATGLNLLQAYLAVQNPDAAQHVLDILFSLNRPELEERLHGFSNAIAEMMTMPEPEAAAAPASAPTGGTAGAAAAPQAPKVGLITVSKPIWFYGLEPMADAVLPPKQGRMRRVAFTQLSLPGIQNLAEALKEPENELTRLSRAVPVWLAETFYLAANYAPVAALATVTMPDGVTRPMIFGAELTTEHLRQVVEASKEGLDYIFTGALREQAGDCELVMRLFEVRGFRERKKLVLRWTPATADAELGQLHAEIRRFMEWTPAGAGMTYAPPASPRAWLNLLGASVGSFLVDKGVLPADCFMPVAADLEQLAPQAATNEAASLAYLTLRARAARQGVTAPEPALAATPLVQQARETLGQ